MLAPLPTHPNSGALATMADQACASPDCFLAEPNLIPADRPEYSFAQPDCCCSPNRCRQNRVVPGTAADPSANPGCCFVEGPNSIPAARPECSFAQPDCRCSPNRCPQIRGARRHSESVSSPDCRHPPVRAGRDSRAQYLRRIRLAVAPVDQDDARTDLRLGWSPGSICQRAGPPTASKIQDSGHYVVV
jgi:hypothetical protein